MTALIIEDEIPASLRLTKLIEGKGFSVVERIQSVSNAIKWFKTHEHPDVVFMDVKLSDGNAFSIFENVVINAKVVFTTAYDEYSLKAFENKGIAYLLKPIDEKKLDYLLNNLDYYRSIFKEEYESIKNNPSEFIVSFGSTLRKIKEKEIICFFSTNNSTFILSDDKRSYPISKSLEKLLSELDADSFFRINRSVIFNKSFIRLIKINEIILNENIADVDFKISRNRIASFKEWFKQ